MNNSDKKADGSIKVGTLLYLNITNGIEDPTKTFKSRVADIRGDRVAIEIPIDQENGRMKPLFPGTEVTAVFYEGSGTRYSFDSKVTDLVKENIPLLLIVTPTADQIKKIQRRDYLRVPSILPLKIKLTDGNDFFDVTTVDVSGGGAAFAATSQIQLQKGNLLNCILEVPQKKGVDQVEFVAEIIRVVPPSELVLVQTVAIRITEIQERNRDKIIRYCFQRELELKKKLHL